MKFQLTVSKCCQLQPSIAGIQLETLTEIFHLIWTKFFQQFRWEIANNIFRLQVY